MNHKSEYEAIKKQIAECEQALKNRCIECSNFNKKKANAQSMALCLLSLFIRKMIVMDSIICRSNLATTPKTRLQRGRIGARQCHKHHNAANNGTKHAKVK